MPDGVCCILLMLFCFSRTMMFPPSQLDTHAGCGGVRAIRQGSVAVCPQEGLHDFISGEMLKTVSLARRKKGGSTNTTGLL